MVDFEKQSYWHERFTYETAFEWLIPSSHFMAILDPYISHLDEQSQVLQIGSGASDLHNHFRGRGLLNITNVDFEPLAIDRGQHLEEEAFGDVKMRYAVADATQLPVEFRGMYHLVVDKGTCDAVACAGEQSMKRMLAGIKACLARGGIYIALSCSSHRFSLEALPFEFTVMAQVPKPKIWKSDSDVYHYCYLLRPI